MIYEVRKREKGEADIATGRLRKIRFCTLVIKKQPPVTQSKPAAVFLYLSRLIFLQRRIQHRVIRKALFTRCIKRILIRLVQRSAQRNTLHQIRVR